MHTHKERGDGGGREAAGVVERWREGGRGEAVCGVLPCSVLFSAKLPCYCFVICCALSSAPSLSLNFVHVRQYFLHYFPSSLYSTYCFLFLFCFSFLFVFLIYFHLRLLSFGFLSLYLTLSSFLQFFLSLLFNILIPLSFLLSLHFNSLIFFSLSPFFPFQYFHFFLRFPISPFQYSHPFSFLCFSPFQYSHFFLSSFLSVSIFSSIFPLSFLSHFLPSSGVTFPLSPIFFYFSYFPFMSLLTAGVSYCFRLINFAFFFSG